MTHCNDFEELISAYADDELTESERQRVEKHLAECDDCSSLLRIYSEISSITAESLEDPPPVLRENIMDSILSGKADIAAAKTKKLMLVSTITTKIIPIAACLAFILIALPHLANITQAPSNDAIMPAESPNITQAAAESAAGIDAGGSPVPATSEYDSDDSQIAIAPALDISSEFVMETEEEDYYSYDDQVIMRSFDPESGTVVNANAPEPALDIEEFSSGEGWPNAPFAHEGGDPQGRGLHERDRSDTPEPPAEVPAPSADAPEPQQDFIYADENVEPEVQSIIAQGYYAYILVSGDLPELLAEFEMTELNEHTYSIIIPRETADELIAISDGTTIRLIELNENNEESALIHYAP